LPCADRAFALECLERVDLLDKALERVDQLSGGQQQRVGIARALAQRPRLVLADEPVASLDPASAEKILELLRRVCKQDGITAILSLHQVELAQAYADRIIGLSHGAVVFDGGAHIGAAFEFDGPGRDAQDLVFVVTRIAGVERIAGVGDQLHQHLLDLLRAALDIW